MSIVTPDCIAPLTIGFSLDERFSAKLQPVNTEEMITQILNNVIADLDSTRANLERAGRKVIDDVRDAADTMGTALLRGVEQEIAYDDLVKLINTMRRGVSRRTVELDG